MKNPNVTLIINPASAGGRTAEKIPAILALFDRYFGGGYLFQLTQKPGDAALIARRAAERGCVLIACAGGDGTLQESVNGMFDAGMPAGCLLGVISTGTGEGFARSLALPAALGEQVALLKSGHARRVDVGRIDFASDSPCSGRRYFINEFQLGIGGAVVRRVNGGRHRTSGAMAYGGSALSTALRYRPHHFLFRMDGGEEFHSSCIGVMIANGEYTGGGMRLAPGADLADGKLNVLLIHAQSLPSRLRGFSRIYAGTHVALPGFSYFTTARIEISADGEAPQEADGQIVAALPCAVSLLPAALRVACAESSGAAS